jgi:acyl-coenzyme A synthetase/AMP-(fatty) acid ligase
VNDLWSTFERTASTNADRVGLICSGAEVSFRHWLARAQDFRSVFASHHVSPGDRILLLVQNTPDMAAALAAVWSQGGIAALLDASAPPSHVAHAVERVTPKLVVCDGAPPVGLPPDVPAVTCVDVPSNGRTLGHAVKRLPTDPASIVFTSGSTGRPKGVVQSHGNLARGCTAVGSYLGLSSADRLLCTVPWSFDYGFGQLLTAMILGVTHIIPAANNPAALCDAIERCRPTVLGGLAPVYVYLMSALSPIRTTDTSSLRLLMNTGGSIPAAVLTHLLDSFPHCQVVLNYGLTETYRSCYLPAELVRERSDSIGIPIPGVDIVIVDETGRVLGPGEEGEIVHRGDYVCLGYWNDPESTSRAVRPDPLRVPGAPDPGRALFTGDYGFRSEDGFVYFRGRRDHQIKSMGVRVSPHEVESLLLAAGAAAEAAVFGMPHDVLGNEVWAAVVAADESVDVVRELQRYSRGVMSQFMQPRRYLRLAKLPRTTTGKVDYPALKALAAQEPAGPKLV